MTETQIEQAEKDARKDAEAFLLLLLLSSKVEFREGIFYVDDKSVSITTIREYIRRIETRVGQRLTNLTDELEKGEITADEWQKGFERNVTSAHILTAALALGSIRKAVQEPIVRSRIELELGYGERFGRKVRGDEISQAQIASRARSYLLAAGITYGILEQKIRALTYTEARRIRRASESCPGCIAYSYRWMPIDEMPRIGSLQCKSRCRCFLEYR